MEKSERIYFLNDISKGVREKFRNRLVNNRAKRLRNINNRLLRGGMIKIELGEGVTLACFVFEALGAILVLILCLGVTMSQPSVREGTGVSVLWRLGVTVVLEIECCLSFSTTTLIFA